MTTPAVPDATYSPAEVIAAIRRLMPLVQPAVGAVLAADTDYDPDVADDLYKVASLLEATGADVFRSVSVSRGYD